MSTKVDTDQSGMPLRKIDPPGKQGHLWLLAALALVWAADSGAYFAGRHFGKHKLAPRISPNKTWEGLFGGLLAGVAVAVGLGWLAGIDAGHLPGLLITSVVAVFASVLGDLFESLIDRSGINTILSRSYHREQRCITVYHFYAKKWKIESKL